MDIQYKLILGFSGLPILQHSVSKTIDYIVLHIKLYAQASLYIILVSFTYHPRHPLAGEFNE